MKVITAVKTHIGFLSKKHTHISNIPTKHHMQNVKGKELRTKY